MNQEIRLLAHISLEVPIEWTKEDMMYMFDNRCIDMMNRDGVIWETRVDILEIEEESELYNLE